jgi:hypothetical protein
MSKKAIFAEDLLAEIERQEGLLGKCDRLEVDNVKAIIRDFPRAGFVSGSIGGRLPGVRAVFALNKIEQAFYMAKDRYLKVPENDMRSACSELNDTLCDLLLAINDAFGYLYGVRR